MKYRIVIDERWFVVEQKSPGIFEFWEETGFAYPRYEQAETKIKELKSLAIGVPL